VKLSFCAVCTTSNRSSLLTRATCSTTKCLRKSASCSTSSSIQKVRWP
jgi:hypothetical protein